MGRLWDRGEPLDELVLQFTAGEDHELDDRLVAYDVKASAAHARMLAAGGYLTADELSKIVACLDDIALAHEAGSWKVSLAEEDCHTAIENRLVHALGDAGKRIHLGRSRNDQVLAAMRLWLKDALTQVAVEAVAVSTALEELAAKDGDLEMPGYTHLQRAMPSTVRLWAQGFASEIYDDAAGLRAARRRADKNPLGSAAGYGVPVLKIDRAATTAELGFAATHEPVTAVQLSRGKAEAAALFELALLAQDLGRLATDLCLFSTAEFGFVKLPEKFTTGSSIMPQKRNPDLFELARARTARAASCLHEVLAITAKLPSGYHRDYQLMKEPLFRSFDTVVGTCRMLAHAVPAITFDRERLASALDPSLRATERAYKMAVEQNIPFRDAYRRVKEEGKAAGS
jgi:argininosuccinate lyase